MAAFGILLVEDDKQDAEFIARLIEKHIPRMVAPEFDDVKVFTVTNQREADRIMEAKQVEMVLLDLQYPSADEESMDIPAGEFAGMKFLPRLRESQPSAAIVILTKHAEVPIVLEALRGRYADDFVPKTDKWEEILPRLQVAWNHAREKRRLSALQNEYWGIVRSIAARTYADDVRVLLSQVKASLLRLARQIRSGDRTAIEDAPRRIEEATDHLLDEFSIVSSHLTNDGETAKEVDLSHDLIAPLVQLYAGPIEIVSIPEKPVTVTTYRGDLRIALHEVLRNALESDASLVRVWVSQSGNDAMLHIVDDGHGLSEEAKAHMFEPGFTTRQKSDVPRGMGLYIARRMMSGIGGEISIDNEEGGGVHAILTVKDLGGQ
jgi:signal transduction histidine kinase